VDENIGGWICQSFLNTLQLLLKRNSNKNKVRIQITFYSFKQL
jgi:hypothetical protein